MADLRHEELVAKFVTIFWMAFVKQVEAKGMIVDEDCFDEAIAKGAMENVHYHLKEISDDYYSNPQGDNFLLTKACSIEAALKAVELAGSKQGESVNRTHYGDAFEFIKQKASFPTRWRQTTRDAAA